MCNNKECANYLKQNPAYNRYMKELQKKWEIYGRVTGSITLKNTSVEERRVLSGIVGETFMEETVKFTFRKFEQGLQKTRFAPIDMKAVLEAYFGMSLYTNQEQKNQVQMEKEMFFEELFDYFTSCAEKTSIVFQWLQELEFQKNMDIKY